MSTWLDIQLTRQFGLISVIANLTHYVLYFCPSALVELIALYLSLSIGNSDVWLVEHGAFELIVVSETTTLMWYLFTLGVGRLHRFFIFSWGSQRHRSVERFFRNARWLEREVGEMFNVWYAKKRDRRALFLAPLLYWGVLRRAFPAGGFFELRLQPGEGRLAAFHISWID